MNDHVFDRYRSFLRFYRNGPQIPPKFTFSKNLFFTKYLLLLSTDCTAHQHGNVVSNTCHLFITFFWFNINVILDKLHEKYYKKREHVICS